MDSNYNYEEELMIKIAWYYYIENLTQQEIAKILGINRIKILRLLDKAKENGLITFQIRNSNAKRFHMENTFKELFHLNDILIIPSVPSSDSLNDSLAQAASMYINQRIKENSYINMGYGDTPSRILNYLAQRSESPINVISLTGGVNYYLPNTESNVFNARLHLIPCPLILSSSFIMEELKNNSVVEEDTEGTVVVITDEEGNEYNYVEEMVFDAGSDKYAILVSIDGDEECECHEHDEECGCEEEVDVILAKIVKDENGEVEYIEPTDEEFEIAQQAYEELMDKLEAEE